MEDERILIGLDLSTTSVEVIEVLLDDATDTAIYEEIAKANHQRPEILKMVAGHPDTPSEVREYVFGILSVPVQSATEITRAAHAEKAHEKTPEMRSESMQQKVQRLNVSARIQLALKGGREIRGILARDPNKEVLLSVLENGKITESEIEMMAKSRSVPEDVLRKISKNNEWMKNYAVLMALVTNPKTPAGISVPFVSDLKTKELLSIEKNRNLAEAVRGAARRVIQWRKPK